MWRGIRTKRNLWLVLNDEVIQLQKQLAFCRGEFNFADHAQKQSS